MSNSTIKKIYVGGLLLFISLPWCQAQYHITGFTPVITGVSYGPYTISGGTTSTADHWCATNGTINGTGNSCVANNGTPNVSVIWNGSGNGTLSYYQGSSTTPVVTYAVADYTVINYTEQNGTANFPNEDGYVALNQVSTLVFQGSAVTIPPGVVTYSWQTSPDGTNFTQLPNSNTQNLTLTQPFTQAQTWINRVVSVNLEGDNYTNTSNTFIIYAVAPVLPGSITPAALTVVAGTNPGTFTASTASGGTMCGSGAYTLSWQTSPDNVNWTTVSGFTGSTFSPGAISATTYMRQIVICGPLAAVTNSAVVYVYSPLQPGTISPMEMTLASGTGPGNLTGNAATGGDVAAGYTYTWEYSTNGTTFQPVSPIVQTQNYNPGPVSTTTYYMRQVSCNGQTAKSNTVTVNVGTASAPTNYIRTRVVTASGITSLNAAYALTALTDVKETEQYLDGMGRLSQTVARQASLPTGGSAADLIVPFQYDATGRQVFTYLPYADSYNSGSYDLNAFPDQNAFDATLFNSQGDNFYYGQTNYEPSPLARVNSISAPGDNWTGSNRANQFLYTSNTVDDQVVVWGITNSGTAGVFGSYSYVSEYATGTLKKQISLNENGHQTIQYKDLNGNVILNKVQLTAPADDGTGSGYTGWLCTYYIYDFWNNLRCVVQPDGVQLLNANGWNMTALSSAVLNLQCFRYEYDARNRIVMKQVPGKQPEYMVYDNLDRVVMTQNGNQRTPGQWTVLLYENALDRPVGKGVWTNTSLTFAGLLSAAYPSTSYPFTLATAPTSGWELMNVTHYDNYTTIPTGLSGTLNTSAIAIGNFYSTTVSPTYALPLTQVTPSSAVTTQGLVTWSQSEILGTGGAQYISVANIYDKRARLIQEQTVNYSGGLDLLTTQYNFIGLPLVTDLRHQKITSGSPPTTQTYEVATLTTYDALERPVQVQKMVMAPVISSPAWKTISMMSYDAVGRMAKKQLGNNPANTGSGYVQLETQSYEYNVRGWMLGMNRNAINSMALTPFFGYELGYDKSGTIVTGTAYAGQQYNGNIGGTVWKNAGDQDIKKYDFTYDAANRLLTAPYTQYYGGTFNNNAGLNFSVSGAATGTGTTGIGYDANGNLLSMNLTGWKGGASKMIDQMTYTPITNSNQLQNVINSLSDQNTTLGDFRYSPKYTTTLNGPKAMTAVDYKYDYNGNLTQDLNKDITSISYNNDLNLPLSYTVAGQTDNGTITFSYDADGNKLSKQVNETGATVNGTSTNITTTTTYIAGFVYQSLSYSSSVLSSLNYTDKLQFFATQEGRVRAQYNNVSSPTTMTGLAFDYFLKDNLGNTRSVITEETETDVYPALTFEGTTPAAVANQNAVWDNASGTSINVQSVQVTPLPAGFNSAQNGTYCGSITKSQGAIGAAKLIRVMAGDQLNVTLNYTYSTATVDNSSANGWNTLLNSLAAMIIGSSGVNPVFDGSSTASALAAAQNNSTVSNFFTVLHPETSGQSTTVPEAYLHILLFNDQFVFDNVNSIVIPITSQGLNAEGTIPPQTPIITKDGYAYVYFSNESNTVVYLDNFMLSDQRSPLLEMNDYYPFGLTMAAASGTAMKSAYAANKYRFNQGSELQNQEFSNGTGLELYETQLRSLDPQLGRWWQVDSKPDFSQSVYAAMDNNPILHNDPFGDTVTVNGFTEDQVTAWLGEGLNTNEDQNPFFFKDHRLQYNKDKLKALSKNQRKAAKNIVEEINSTKMHIVQKADDNTVTSVDPRRVFIDKTLGPIDVPPTYQHQVKDQAGLTVQDKDDPHKITHFVNQSYFDRNSTNNAPVGSDGKPIENPIWVVMFHELGGHGYYRYEVPGGSQTGTNQAGKTVDYENIIRNLNHLQIRSYDAAHMDPCEVPQPPAPPKAPNQ
jgi:RHS repeat-associated protein